MTDLPRVLWLLLTDAGMMLTLAVLAVMLSTATELIIAGLKR